MDFDAMLQEAGVLYKASTRLEALADHSDGLGDRLMAIAQSVRNAASLLEVLVATKSPKLRARIV